ncbi:MAG: DnaA regulatory inactivator Hda [Burkholderiaceae bacterium]|nr:DnaA regulatory inactivator Hda [Burkholderiaceae bacterium]
MKHPRQLLLGLNEEKPQSFATFVAGPNLELMQFLPALAAGRTKDKFAYLWGSAGAGKTHLLHAAAETPGARYIAHDAPAEQFHYTPQVSLYLVDDCDKLSDQAQIDVFALFNQVREHGAAIVTAGSAAPAHLNLREDLRTRLGWGLVYQVHELTDEDKLAALNQAAAARRMNVAPAVLPYLITHLARDMRSLSATLDALDAYSLETKRPITLPLLRELLQLEKEETTE